MDTIKEQIAVSCELEYDDKPTELRHGEKLVSVREDGSIEFTRRIGYTNSPEVIAAALRGKLGVLRGLWNSYEGAYELAKFPCISTEIIVDPQTKRFEVADTLLMEVSADNYCLAHVTSAPAINEELGRADMSGQKAALGKVVGIKAAAPVA